MNGFDVGSDRTAGDGPRSRTPEDETSRPEERFARSVLDGLSAHVAVLDGAGTIVAANEAWKAFAAANGADPRTVSEGADYLGACESASGPNAEGAAAFAAGIREVLAGRRERFELEYPCHSPTRRRWFVARVSRLPQAEPPRAVVAHEVVTDRRRREEERASRRLAQAAARARAQEQREIGRELHDRVAHAMAVVHQSIQLHKVYRGRDLEKAAEKLDLAERMTAEALAQTRDLSRALAVDEAAQGLGAALSGLLSALVPPGMTHELRVEGEAEEATAEVREQLFLVLREAVRNAVTHSGASKLSVQVGTDRGWIVGVVKDDGRGFERKAQRERPEAGGLAHMAERASLMGGACSIESAPGEGTRVEASFPLDGA